jgi:hypothetical protein
MKYHCGLSRQFAIGLLCILAVGCRPKSQNMLVAYVQGDVFLPHLNPGYWAIGEAKWCAIASRYSDPLSPDARGDLLLCGETTQLAWSQTWLRGDIKTQIYEAAKQQAVSFHSIGHNGSSRGSSPRWLCRSAPQAIDCE